MPFDFIRTTTICALHDQYIAIYEALEVVAVTPMEARSVKRCANAQATIVEIALVIVPTSVWIVASVWIETFPHLVCLSVCVLEPDKHEMY